MQLKQARKWHRFLLSARTRILAWYIVLMATSSMVSILAIRQELFTRVQERVERSLSQEVQEFRRLVKSVNPKTNKPFASDEVIDLFDLFVARNIPDDDEFLLTLFNGRLYKHSPRALPEPLQQDSPLIQHWGQLTKPERGQITTTLGELLYLAEPVKITYQAEPINSTEDVQGVFVVAHMTTGERGEVDEAIAVVVEVTIIVLTAASILAWAVAGKVLAPLRLLTKTALSITNNSDLTQRIPVQGGDEIAELTITFNEMMARLEDAFISQRNFINDASHELRTPITIIRGHLELLSDDPQERRETMELIADELDRMNRFVDDLLILAKAEQPQFLRLETVDVKSLIEEVYTKAKTLATRNWRLDNRGCGTIVADRQRLTQAIINLAQNATQHTRAEDVIALGSIVRKGKARFWVSDTGQGIAYSDQKRVFQRFARGVNGRRSEGAGLGLAIVQAIATAHGGCVELSSQPGVGSTFALVIPVDPPSPESN
jgi:signal transduction histidine kinase